MEMKLQMVKRTGHPDFLDLAWHLPLARWQSDRFVDVPKGIFRHVVRFVEYDGNLYALKELPRRLAEREYRLLSELARLSIPAVEGVGVVTGRTDPTTGEELDAVLITRHLAFSLPYRTLFAGRGTPDLHIRLLDGLANLLVRLHLAGFFWGDCSLSNTLFRRDAGALAAYLVDAETGELHPQLSDGQRRHDLALAEENIAGELMDLAAGGRVTLCIEPEEAATELRQRYEAQWSELTRNEVFDPDESYRIAERLHRLNDLGFDVGELELVGDGDRFELRLHPRVVEPGHHTRRLHALAGVTVQENQARRLLNEITCYRMHLEHVEGRQVPEHIAAYRWLSDVFDPTIAAVPADLRGKLEPAELFHEILEHRWARSEASGREFDLPESVASYADAVLRHVPDERTLLASAEDEELSLVEVS